MVSPLFPAARLYRNVNDAFQDLVLSFDLNDNRIVEKDSRNGPVKMFPYPVTVGYTHPRERVLFNPVRDANPFFHLFESLWMLAGRNDVAPLKYYVSTMGQFSDDGKTFNGAYGYRWRHTHRKPAGARCRDELEGMDQLNLLIEHLKNNPNSRRAVLQMWNVEDDLLKIDDSKDVCCNLSVMFSIREEEIFSDNWDSCQPTNKVKYLDMTVTNRSNDLIWGMLGANAVHFSFLQEYIANCLGVEVGTYWQFTNNLHVYTSTNSGWKPEEWLEGSNDCGLYYRDGSPITEEDQVVDPCPIPFVEDKKVFDEEVQEFIDHFSSNGGAHPSVWQESFLERVAAPVCRAYTFHKQGNSVYALECLDSCIADDWRVACKEWIQRRIEKKERAQDVRTD